MSTFSGQVSVGTDDADQTSTGTNSTTNTNTGIRNTTSPARPYWACRFPNVTIAGSASVSAAALSVYCPTAGLSMDVKIFGVKQANPSTFNTTLNNISGLPLTTASVTWNATLTQNTFNASPDITSIINELLAQGGWASGDAMAFVLVAQSTTLSCTVENYDGVPAEAAKLSVTYSTATPPGAPTNLSVTGQTNTTISLSWTQGSGTVTDNLVEVSTDGSTWGAPIDIGSAVTSYTVTGLIQGTIYFFRVAAQNTNGTSAYTYWVVSYTGTVLTNTITLSPVSDGTTTGWTITGAASANAALTDGLDTSYVAAPASAQTLTVNLSNAPLDLLWVTAVQFNIRVKSTNGSHLLGPIEATVPAGSISFGVTFGTITTAFANYTSTISGLDSDAASDGIQNLAAWTGAQLVLQAQDTNAVLEIAEASVTITYWYPQGETTVPVPISPPLCGLNSTAGGITSASRRNQVEGTRYNYSG